MLAVVAVAVGIALAVGSSGGGADGTDTAQDSAPVGPQRGERAPQVTLPTANNDDVTVGGDGAEHVIVASFLAPGCPSCGAEVPALREVRAAYPDATVQVVIVDVSGAPLDQADAIAAYYAEQLGGGPDLVYALDPEAEAFRDYEVRALGTTVVLDTEGIVRFRDERTSSVEQLSAALDKAHA